MYSKDLNLTKILYINSKIEYKNLHFEHFRTTYIGMKQQKQFKSLFTKNVGAQAFKMMSITLPPFLLNVSKNYPCPQKHPCETFLRVENSLTVLCGIETGWEVQLRIFILVPSFYVGSLQCYRSRPGGTPCICWLVLY